MKQLLQLLAVILNRLPKSDWKPIPLCGVYYRYGVPIPNLVGHVTAPSVSTDTTPSSITQTSAVFDTNSITSTNNENASVRGICYVVGTGTPTTSDTVVSTSGSFAAGNYSSTMTGLTANTTYSVRAYATNSGGTGYGSTVTFTTLANQPPTVSLTAEPDTSSQNPVLEFTGTDPEGNDIRYNVQVDTVSTFDSQSSIVTLASYSETNGTGSYGSLPAGQSFIPSQTANISTASMLLSKDSGSTGTVYAAIYSHTGTYGANTSTPNTRLASSDTVSLTNITTSLSLIEFTFSGANQIQLQSGTPYFLIIENGGVTGTLRIGRDATSPTHGGTEVFSNLSNPYDWTSFDYDDPFYIKAGSAAPIISKISGTDPGFLNTVNGADTDPFTSGQMVSYTVQAGDALALGTYYWRVRAKDAVTGEWGEWSTTDEFVISNPNFPSVTTNAVSSIGSYTATANGNVTSQGGGAITQRGFAYATTQNPTTSNSTVIVSGTTGAFSGSLTSLTANTTYYVRAYAVNSFGTVYGSQVSFTTLPPPLTAPILNQARADGTYVPTGSNIPSATSPYFRIEVPHNVKGSALTLYGEVENVATSFNNVSNMVSDTGLTTDVFGSQNPPTALRSHTIVYDSIRNRLIQFGGWDGSNNTNEMWELSLHPNSSPSKPRWRTLFATGSYPPARRLHGAVFDAVNNRMIIFGGYTTTDTNLMYSCSFASSADGAWTTLSPTGTAPAARSNISGAFIVNPSTNIAYLFGGWGASHYNDLFSLNLNTTNPAWTTLKANGTAGNPIGRRDHIMKLDAARNRLIIAFGYTGTAYLNDTWDYVLSGTTFTQLTSSLNDTLPNARSLLVGEVDTVNNQLLITGGYQGAVGNLQRDVWAFDLTTANRKWTNVTPASAYELPNPTYASASCYDSVNNLMLWNFGMDVTNDQQRHLFAIKANDFVMSSNAPTNTATVYGLSQNTYKAAQDAAGLVVNHQDGEVLSIGGYGNMVDDATIITGEHLSEVYLTSQQANNGNIAWRNALKGMFSFHNREGVLCAWDSSRKRALVFGGLRGVNSTFNDLWELKRSDDGLYTAKRLNPTGTRPGQRWLGAAGYDAVNDRLVIYGGEDGDATLTTDMWVCSFSGSDQGVWSSVSATGTAHPGGWGYTYCQDWVNNKLYVQGGSTTASEGPYSNVFSVLDLSTLTWTRLTSGPGARRSAAMAFTPASTNPGRSAPTIYFFGGHTGSVQNDTYIYNITSDTWGSNITGTGLAGGPPAARRSHVAWSYIGTSALYADFVVTDGRPASGTWFSDAFNYNEYEGFYASQTISRYLTYRLKAPVTIDASYHWQAWYGIGLNSGAKTSYGGNSESSADYIIGAAGVALTGMKKVFVSGAWTPKPVKTWNGSNWVAKKQKIWNGSAWVESVE